MGGRKGGVRQQLEGINSRYGILGKGRNREKVAKGEMTKTEKEK